MFQPCPKAEEPKPRTKNKEMATDPYSKEGPVHYMALLMEFTMLYIDDNYVGFTTTMLPDNLTNMALLNPTMSESSSVLPFGPLELSSILQRAVKDAGREGKLKAALNRLFQPDKAQTLKCVESLINSELKARGTPEQHLMGVNLRTKAFLLGKHRILGKLQQCTQPTDYTQNPERHEFKVLLITLVGGHGANSKTTKLTFTYNTPFERFEKALQTETQLCMIPPLDIYDLTPFQGHRDPSERTTPLRIGLQETVNGTDTTQPKTAHALAASSTVASPPYRSVSSKETPPTQTSTCGDQQIVDQSDCQDSLSGREIIEEKNYAEGISAPQESGGMHPSYIFFEYETNWVIPLCPRNRRVKGFTLVDGPWCYCIVDMNGNKGEVQELKDEETYLSVLHYLKTKNRVTEKILEKTNLELESMLKSTDTLLADALKHENQKLEKELKPKLENLYEELQKNKAMLNNPKSYECTLMIQHSMERLAREKWLANIQTKERSLRNRIVSLDDTDVDFDYLVEDTTPSYSQTMI